MLIRASKSMPASSLAAAGRANHATQIYERVAGLEYTGLSKWGLGLGWHPHLVKSQLSLNPGNGEGKRAEET